MQNLFTSTTQKIVNVLTPIAIPAAGLILDTGGEINPAGYAIATIVAVSSMLDLFLTYNNNRKLHGHGDLPARMTLGGMSVLSVAAIVLNPLYRNPDDSSSKMAPLYGMSLISAIGRGMGIALTSLDDEYAPINDMRY